MQELQNQNLLLILEKKILVDPSCLSKLISSKAMVWCVSVCSTQCAVATKNQGWMVAKSFRKMRKQSQILTNNDVFPSSCQPYYVVPQYSKAKQTALEQGQYSLLLVRPCIFGPKTRICNRKVAIKNKDVMEQTLCKLDCSFCLIQLLNNKFHVISLWRLCITFV